MFKKTITGHDTRLIEELESAGIIPKNCRRVILDISYDEEVKLYYETLADERLLDVDLGAHLVVFDNKQGKTNG